MTGACNRPALAWRPVALIALTILAILLVLANRYGFHRDELYFVVAGRHPDWGYVDQPPFAPLWSALSASVLGLSPLALRILPAISTAIVIGLAAAMAREFGGARRAQLLAAMLVAVSGLVGLGHLDSTATYDVLAWTVISWLVIRLLRGGDPRLWLAVGFAGGIGLQNKHLVLLLAVGLVMGFALSRRWEMIRSGWVWASIGLAALIWLPNLVWQALNGFPQLGMGAAVAARSSLGDVLLVLPFQLILVGLFLSPAFVAGLWWLLRGHDAIPWRSVGWAYLVALALTIVLRGQLYYPAGLYPAILAAGAIVTDRWLDRGHRRLRATATTAGAVASAAFIGVVMLPLLPPTTLAGTPIPDIYAPAGEQIGWPELVGGVEGVVAALPAEERDRAVIFTTNYGVASALILLGDASLPPVHSGHNSYADWGPPPDHRDLAILVGHWRPERRSAAFGSCEQRGTIGNRAGVRNEELGGGIWICDRMPRAWSELWEALSFYG